MRTPTFIPLATALALIAVPTPALGAAPRSGDLVITEIAANPTLPEPGAEFVVVDNVSNTTLLIDGLRLTDAIGTTRGVVPRDTSLEPGQRIALQPRAGAAAYGCSPAPHRALLSAWAPLNNLGDTVALERDDGAVLDRVIYPREAFALEGRSRRLDPAYRTPAANDDFARWSPSPGAATPCTLPGPRPGTVRFAAGDLFAGEQAPSVRLTLRRDGGTNGRIAVPYRTVDGSATAGADYRASSGAVSLAATQSTATFTVPLLDDARDEPHETFAVVLGAPSGGAALGQPARAIVRIGDDDPAAGPMPTPTLPGAPAFPPSPPPAPAPPPAQLPPPPLPPPPGAGGPAGGPAPGPAPRASVAVAAWQPVLRRGVAAAVGCDADCTLETSADIALGRGRFIELKSVTRRLAARATTVVRLRVPGRRVRALRRALRRRGWLRATVTATPVGGAAVERRVRVR